MSQNEAISLQRFGKVHSFRALSIAGIFLYAMVLFAFLRVRPLWLDEVVQLVYATAPRISVMLKSIRENPGAMPLGYLIQRPFLQIDHITARSRLPSVLAAIGSCLVLLRLTRAFGISRRAALLTLLVFMALPSVFRYALEARPYEEALLLTLLSMWSSLVSEREKTITWAGIHSACVTCALYLQPYSVLPALGMAAPGAWEAIREKAWKRAVLTMSPFAFALSAFIPWYLYSRARWSAGIEVAHLGFKWSPSLLLDAVKGLSGGSVLCSCVLLALCGCACMGMDLRPRNSERRCCKILASAAVVTVGGVFICDVAQDYFFATRQLLFAVPALTILAGHGLNRLLVSRRYVCGFLAGLLLATSTINDLRYQRNAPENWRLAATRLDEIALQGYCLKTVRHDGITTPFLIQTSRPVRALDPRVPPASRWSRICTTVETTSPWQARGWIAPVIGQRGRPPLAEQW